MVKKMILFTIFVILFFVFAVPVIFTLTLNMYPAGDQPGYGTKTLEIYGQKSITQTFTSVNDNLTAIATSIKNPNLKNKNQVLLELFDGNGNIVRRSVLSGMNIEDGSFVKFIFEPISDSKGKTYKFTLSSIESGSGDLLKVFIMDGPTEDITEYVYEEENFPGGMPLVFFHKPESKSWLIKTIYSNLFSRLL